MSAGPPTAKFNPAAGLIALALLISLACLAQEQQSASSERLPFSVPEQEAYLEDLIRNAPKGWEHGKDWVLIQPYLLGRNVTQPSSRTDCPAAGLLNALSDGADIPSWIYSGTGICAELAANHDSAVIVLEDRKDIDAGYFLFLACDAKRSRKQCDMEGFVQPEEMKLAESSKKGHRHFDVQALTMENKTAHFPVAEVWHMRNVEGAAGTP